MHTVVSRAELAKHVHTLPDQPDLIPYRTGYFTDDLGFCLSHKLWLVMTDEDYRVDVDSELFPGELTYGELFLPGETPEGVLVTCHVCHPSLANVNLSGIAVATALAMRRSPSPIHMGMTNGNSCENSTRRFDRICTRIGGLALPA